MIKKILIVVMVTLMVACSTGLKVEKNNGVDELKGEFVQYNLLNNQIDVVLTLRKMEMKPGPFVAYAKEYLEIEPKIKKTTTRWAIEGIKHYVSSSADPLQMYYIKGDINRIDAENIAEITSLGQIERPIISDYKEESAWNHIPDFPERTLKNIMIENSKTSYKYVVVDSVTKRIPIENKVLRNKTEAEMAKDASKTLMKIRKRKLRLIGGINEKFPSEGDIQFMVKKLEEKEREYLELFMGKMTVSTRQVRVSLTPDDYKSYYLCNFSETDGQSDSKSSDSQLILTIKPSGSTEIPYVSVVDHKSLLPYRVPANAIMEISLAGEILYQSSVSISQLGNLQYLPLNFLTTKKIHFNKITGALERIK